MTRLDNKVAVITGAGSGIGEATAQFMAAAGAMVVVADINRESAEKVASGIEAKGGRAVPFAGDVAIEEDVEHMISSAVQTFGSVNILHNNAAITSMTHQSKDGTVIDMEVDVWDRSIAVILRGTMLGCKYAVPHMIESGGGSIINTAAVSGLSGDVNLTAYATAKAGVIGLTRCVASAFGKQNVRCNAIAPGMVMTPAVTGNISPEIIGVFVRNNLLPRVGEPVDIARLVTFLASDDSSYVTGEVIRIDGGFLSHLPTFAHLDATYFDAES